MKQEMLQSLHGRREELARKAHKFQERRTDPALRLRMQAAMKALIRPRPEDLRDERWYEPSKERLRNLSTAIQEVDVLKAMKHGLFIRPTAHLPASTVQSDFDEAILCDYIDESRELAGLTEVLSWLESFKAVLEKGDAVASLNHLVQLGTYRATKCDCDEDILTDIDRAPSLAWLHQHHLEYNRAVWELISSKHGTIDALRQAIQADLDGPRERQRNRWYGKISAVSYAHELLRHFVKAKPSSTWVGRPSKTKATVSA